MNKLKDIFGALAVIALLGLANALATNASEYAAPTLAEIEADILTQRIILCDAPGRPSEGKPALKGACRDGLKLYLESGEQR